MQTVTSKDGTAIAYEIYRRGRGHSIGLPVEHLEPMKADPSWEKMTRYAHTLAYDGRIVQGTQDGAPLPAGRWLITQPVEVIVGEGSNRSSTTAPGSWPNCCRGPPTGPCPVRTTARSGRPPTPWRPRSPSSSTRRPAEPCACGGGCWW